MLYTYLCIYMHFDIFNMHFDTFKANFNDFKHFLELLFFDIISVKSRLRAQFRFSYLGF